MDRPRILRLLRIAFSVVCGIACLLLVVLWVRSYWRFDMVFKDDTKGGYIISLFNGSLAIDRGIYGGGNGEYKWTLSGSPGFAPMQRGRPLYGFVFSPGYISIPVWLGALLFGIFAALARIKWSKQFSLRTLLIATTLVAVVLGLAVALQ